MGGRNKMVGWRVRGLMCPSWAKAGLKWLSVKLNWLHYKSTAPESISDITHPSQDRQLTLSRGNDGSSICRMRQPLWFRCAYCCFACCTRDTGIEQHGIWYPISLLAGKHIEQVTLHWVWIVTKEEHTFKTFSVFFSLIVVSHAIKLTCTGGHLALFI